MYTCGLNNRGQLGLGNNHSTPTPIKISALSNAENSALNSLLVFSPVNGDFKFPGGGIEAGETHADALRREADIARLPRLLRDMAALKKQIAEMRQRFEE